MSIERVYDRDLAIYWFSDKEGQHSKQVVYDLTKLKSVRTTHTHDGYPVTKRDGFVFKDPNNKANALLGIIKITE